MDSRMLDIAYVDIDPATAWPLRPWAEATTAPAGQTEAGSGTVPAPAAAAAGPRKTRDRGASAVEWVVITAIVVAIVTGVGVAIKDAITKKTTSTTDCITNSGAACPGGKAP